MKYVSIILFLFSIQSVYGSIDLYFEKLTLEEELRVVERENRNFKHLLSLRESSGDSTKLNSIGAMGLWQFMPQTLKDLGFKDITPLKFKADPQVFPAQLQEQALDKKIEKDLSLLTYQWWRKSSSINYLELIGTEINGIPISLAGILAACHLAGAGGVIKYFDSQGQYNPSDVYGTSIRTYLKEFSKYKYTTTNELKTRILCLEDSLNSAKSLTPLLKLSKLLRLEQPLKGMETLMILKHQRSLLVSFRESTTYHLSLRLHSQNTTEVCCTLGVHPLRDMVLECLMVGERLNGTTRSSGTELWYQPSLYTYQKTQECFNSTLLQCGMPRGGLNLQTSFQYFGLRRLQNFPQLGVA